MCLEAETLGLSDELGAMAEGKGVLSLSLGLGKIPEGYLCVGAI